MKPAVIYHKSNSMCDGCISISRFMQQFPAGEAPAGRGLYRPVSPPACKKLKYALSAFFIIFVTIMVCTPTTMYAQQIKSIRSIDSIVAVIDHRHNWAKTDTISLEGSIEGGFAVFYYRDDRLQKIAATYYGETYREETTYYLSGRELLFVLEKTYRYNRPITYDTADMKANNDDEVFDLKKSTVLEQKNYFSSGHLFRRVDETGAVITSHLRAEEQRIIHDLKNNLGVNYDL